VTPLVIEESLGTANQCGSLFFPVDRCWVCGGRRLRRYHQCGLSFREYRQQDPELDRYTGQRIWLLRCLACGFGQPECMPTLPNYFERMYDQHWSEDWVAGEFTSEYRDLIFRTVLRELSRRCEARTRRLLDVGAHAGRFMHLAQQAGWEAEGIELNPRTAAWATRRTGAPVHRVNAQALGAGGRRYGVVTLSDVLEHIPYPVTLLTSLARLLEPGGCIAVKVPSGPGQYWKERVLAAFCPGHKISLAENLVHINHFSARSLRLALERAGFARITIRTGAPELRPQRSVLATLSNAVRMAVYAGGQVPGAVFTPAALNLQAYAVLPG
jgi:2-polyprenyl-3-methyl-5-hydroxy-6-metoxy-1,4-benzoquinol methylase